MGSAHHLRDRCSIDSGGDVQYSHEKPEMPFFVLVLYGNSRCEEQMTVFVDDMFKYPMGRFRRMKMSHMIADTDEELHLMADAIGANCKWFQGDHYDISIGKRILAIENGAIEITLRQCGIMVANKRRGWPMGTPDTCVAISRKRVEADRYLEYVLGG